MLVVLQLPTNLNLLIRAQLLGHTELMFRLSMMCNEDIKSRISYSKQILPLADADLGDFIIPELSAVGLGVNTFDEAALQVVLRAVQGNLCLCRNLCYASLIAACMDSPTHLHRLPCDCGLAAAALALA